MYRTRFESETCSPEAGTVRSPRLFFNGQNTDDQKEENTDSERESTDNNREQRLLTVPVPVQKEYR